MCSCVLHMCTRAHAYMWTCTHHRCLSPTKNTNVVGTHDCGMVSGNHKGIDRPRSMSQPSCEKSALLSCCSSCIFRSSLHFLLEVTMASWRSRTHRRLVTNFVMSPTSACATARRKCAFARRAGDAAVLSSSLKAMSQCSGGLGVLRGFVKLKGRHQNSSS